MSAGCEWDEMTFMSDGEMGRAGPISGRGYDFTERFSTMIRMDTRNVTPEPSAIWQEDTSKGIGWMVFRDP
jgi:hypothetical protein